MDFETVDTVPDLLDAASSAYGSRRAISQESQEGEICFSYSELKERADLGASHIQRLKSGRSRFVLLLMEPCPDWVASFFAILKSGRAVIPVPANTPVESLRLIIQLTAVEAVILGPRTAQIGKELTSLGINIEVIPSEEIFVEEAEVDDLPENSADDVALVAFTSGSTQRLRAVEITHRNLISDLDALLQARSVHQNSIFLSMLSPAHLFELLVGLLAPMSCGAEVVYMTTLLPNRIIDTLRNRKITHSLAVPALLNILEQQVRDELIDADLVDPARRQQSLAEIVEVIRTRQRLDEWEETRSGIRERIGDSLSSIIIGGAALDPCWVDLCELVGIGLDVGYGLTEASPVVCIGTAGGYPKGSVGRVLPGVEIKIDERGEALVRGPNVMKGYFGDPEGTAQTIREGWLYTGDHGYLDDQGYLFITGRFKEAMVTAAGETIYPEEIEPHYQDEHFAESCVVPLLGDDGNDVPALVVHPLTPNLSDEELQAVFDELRAKAPARCRVSRFFAVKQPLPRTPIGKVKRRALAATLEIESQS